MSREKKKRRCRYLSNTRKYTCSNQLEGKEISILLDEFEAIRLCDYEGRSQVEASEIMGISRGTIQRLLNSGRKKFVEAILESKGFLIENSYM